MDDRKINIYNVVSRSFHWHGETELLEKSGGDLSTYSIIEKDALLAEFEEDWDTLGPAIAMVTKNHGPLLAKLTRAIDSEDNAQVHATAHELKGALSNFSCPKLVQVFQQLEDAGKTADAKIYLSLLQLAKSLTGTAIKELNDIKNQHQAN